MDGESSGCLLVTPATVVSTQITYSSYRSGHTPSYHVTLRYLGRTHAEQDLQSGTGFDLLQTGQQVQVQQFKGHLLEINADDVTITPSWSPGKWKQHVITGALALLVTLGILALPLASAVHRRQRTA